MTRVEKTKNTSSNPILQTLLSREGNLWRLLIIVVLLFAAFSLARPENFPTLQNVRSMAFQASELGILAIAVGLTMLTGGIDLSINSTANLTGILAALVLTTLLPNDPTTADLALAITVALVIATLTGFLCGLFNGVLVAFVGIPPILATLGTFILYEGIGTAITGGPTVSGQGVLSFIGSGTVAGFPTPLLILLALALLITVILNRSKYGFEVYLLGTNETASQFSGINNRRVLLTTYIASGLLSAVAGIIVLGRTDSASVNFGNTYVLLAIFIAVLGGIDPYGGSGRMVGVLLALTALQILSTGLNLVLREFTGANFFKEFAWGALLLIVLVVNHYINKRRT